MAGCWDGDVTDFDAIKELEAAYIEAALGIHAAANPTQTAENGSAIPTTEGAPIWIDANIGSDYADYSEEGEKFWENAGSNANKIWGTWMVGNYQTSGLGDTRTALFNIQREINTHQGLDPALMTDEHRADITAKIEAFKEAYPDLAQCTDGLQKQATDDYRKFLTELMDKNDMLRGLPEEIARISEGAKNSAVGQKCLAARATATDRGVSAEDLASVQFDPATSAACEAYDAAMSRGADLKERKEALVASATSTGKEGIVFKEQCFLLGHIYQLSQLKQTLDEEQALKSLPYQGGGTNACLLAQGDPFAFMNKLTQHIGKDGDSSKAAFFDMKTAQLSSLQPMIRLFKVISDKKGNESQIEMKFDSFYTSMAYPWGATMQSAIDRGAAPFLRGGFMGDLEDFLMNKKRRGHGVGIKKFTFSYEADNPFAIKKSIKAKLVLHANTFDELLRDRGDYSYADLALKTGGLPDGPQGCKPVTTDQINPLDHDVSTVPETKLNFRLKAIVGWARPGTDSLIPSGDPLKKAIEDSCITLNLTPTIHEFNIDEQGRVEFVLNYLAYVEDFFDQSVFNIFSDPTVTVSQLNRKLQYQEYNKTCETEKVNELRSSQKDLMQAEIDTSMQSLVTNLLNERKIQFLDIPLAELVTFQAEGPIRGEIDLAPYILGMPPGYEPTLTEQLSSDVEVRTNALRDVNPAQAVSYFYISDLIDIILKGIEKTLVDISEGSVSVGSSTDDPEGIITEQQIMDERANYVRYLENFKKFRLLLGPMEIVHTTKADPVTGKGGTIESKMICMGDVPISVRYFIEWLTKKMLKKDEAVYPLPKFLNDLFNEFLRTFLNNDTCFSNVAKQSTKLAQASLTAYKETVDGPDEITAAIQRTTYDVPLDDATMRANSDAWRQTQLLVEQGVLPADAVNDDMITDVRSVPAKRLRIDRSELSYPLLSISGQRGTAIVDPGFAKEINYLVYFAARTYPTEKMNGDKDEDQTRGIWHYQIGKPTGIIKNINLTKTDAPGLKEVRFEQQGYDGLQQLREMYDAKISTYADVSAFPGNYIFIDPAGFSPSVNSEYDLTQLGVGGYHMIIRSEHTFGPGVANSEITAKWVAEITKPGCVVPKQVDEEDKEVDYSKCTLPSRQAAAAESGT